MSRSDVIYARLYASRMAVVHYEHRDRAAPIKLNLHQRGTAHSAHAVKPATKFMWHTRLGHPASRVVDLLANRKLIEVSDSDSTHDTKHCGGCISGKMTRRHFPTNESRESKRKLELVHSDLCGPMSIPSLGGARYFLVIVDDATRFSYVVFFKKKSDTLKEFKTFVNMMSTQGYGQVRALRTDNGTEYVNKAFRNYLSSKGIEHQTSAPFTPEQNGLAERTNRTLVEKARCMLEHAHLPRQYWAEAIAAACYLKNLTPTRVIGNKIPRQEFLDKDVSYCHLRTFGCLAHVHIPKVNRKKFDPVSKPCVFVGYTSTSKQYRFIDIATKRLVVCATATFQEDKTFVVEGNTIQVIHNTNSNEHSESQDTPPEATGDSKVDTPTRNEEMPNSEDESRSVIDVNEEANPVNTPIQQTPPRKIRRSTRHSTPPKRLTYERADSDDDEDVAAMLSAVTNEDMTYEDATTGSDAMKWKDSMRREYDALVENKSWTLSPLPAGRKVIPCRWVYKIKPATRAEDKLYKSRLVAKGFKQVFGVDYNDTYAPVVKLSALRILLSVAITKRMHVHGMDVKNAFLNSKLDHKIYLSQPEGFVDNTNPNYVCKLNKALYGLKQSPRQWYNTIKPVLESVGVNSSPSDSGIFSGMVDNALVLMGIYVDDLFIACESLSVLQSIKDKLSSTFAMKDLGVMKHYLGIDINYEREKGAVTLSQRHFIDEVLKRFSMSQCKSSSTPMEAKSMQQPHIDGDSTLSDKPYRKLIGSVMYILLCTRPDISFPVGVLSKFLQSPTNTHWTSAKRILRYLQGTISMSLLFKRGNNLSIVGYCDADWASASDRKSTTGYCIFVGGNLVSWKSKKQSVVALSSTESEIIAATETMRELLWIRNIVTGFDIEVGTPKLFCDSQPAIAIANTGALNGRSKHMDVKYAFMTDMVSTSQIYLHYIPTADNIADTFTKPLSRSHFETLRRHLCLTSTS